MLSTREQVYFWSQFFKKMFVFMQQDDSNIDISFKNHRFLEDWSIIFLLLFFLSYISGLTVWGGTILVQRNSWQGTFQSTSWVCCWDSQTEGPWGGQEDALCEYDGIQCVLSSWMTHWQQIVYSFALETPEDSRHSNRSRHYCGKRKKALQHFICSAI